MLPFIFTFTFITFASFFFLSLFHIIHFGASCRSSVTPNEAGHVCESQRSRQQRAAEKVWNKLARTQKCWCSTLKFAIQSQKLRQSSSTRSCFVVRQIFRPLFVLPSSSTFYTQISSSNIPPKIVNSFQIKNECLLFHTKYNKKCAQF